MAVLFPKWSTDRLKKEEPSLSLSTKPLALYEHEQNALRVCALDDEAERLELYKGQALTDARAMCPQLVSIEARPTEDAKAFRKLCECLIRYSPLVSIEAIGGVFIDVTGCSRLFGCEEDILTDIAVRLAKVGFQTKVAIADTAGGAWGLAQYGGGGVNPPGQIKAALASLPVEALRLEWAISDSLRRLGLKHVGQLYEMPRASMTARFTEKLLKRIGQALGTVPEPLDPVSPAPQYFADLKLIEPITLLDSLAGCLVRLSDTLSDILAKAGKGARRFELTLFRVDNQLVRVAVGASEPARQSAHIQRLFQNKLDDLGSDYDAGFGFEQLRLSAFEAAPVANHQHAILGYDDSDIGLAELKDRLSNRLGQKAVCHLQLRDSYLPERADAFAPVMASGQSLAQAGLNHHRPIKILPRPEEIEALAQVPDGPPIRFKWRRVSYKIARASGPERIADEWWRQEAARPTRDYYRIEDENGRRYWIFREGLFERESVSPKWFLHGFFA